jgi:hypothetical protein
VDASLAKREAWGEVSALRCIAKACMFCRQSRQLRNSSLCALISFVRRTARGKSSQIKPPGATGAA